MTLDYKALIIDDSAHYRMIISTYLKTLGFTSIETAEDGQEGVAKTGTFAPHLVYLDGIMPTMDGITALEHIKRTKPETVVVISSSLSEKSKVLEFKHAGADFYLLKPYERSTFEEVTRKAIAVLESRRRSVP